MTPDSSPSPGIPDHQAEAEDCQEHEGGRDHDKIRDGHSLARNETVVRLGLDADAGVALATPVNGAAGQVSVHRTGAAALELVRQKDRTAEYQHFRLTRLA